MQAMRNQLMIDIVVVHIRQLDMVWPPPDHEIDQQCRYQASSICCHVANDDMLIAEFRGMCVPICKAKQEGQPPDQRSHTAHSIGGAEDHAGETEPILTGA